MIDRATKSNALDRRLADESEAALAASVETDSPSEHGPARWYLRFPEPHEAIFLAYYSRRFRGQMQMALLLCLLGLAAVPVFQYFLMPSLFGLQWPWRLANYAALLIVIVLAYTRWMQRWHQCLLLAAALLLLFHVLMLAAIAQPPIRYAALAGLPITLMVETALLRLLFPFALLYCTVFLSVTLSWLLQAETDTALQAAVATWLLLGSVAALLMSWLLERGVRHSYLQLRLLQIEKAETRAANEELQRLAERDGLTGIANRRRFDRVLEQEWRRTQRSESALSLLMIDVDFFKKYNDNYGHQAGDECLRVVATAISGALHRSGELAARYGGEEFAVILPEQDAESALRCAERVRAAVELCQLPHAASEIGPVVTVSIGAASLLPTRNNTSANLIALADQALYRAKHEGRNRSVLAQVKHEI